ncbi:MAG: 2-amino-4-hydroxy-6-hydroxymethyldihydropteridine diphosphokinase [Deltaproteobacteria bacterium]|nr:2-amino-4-hydroxy-6-hydroxymethyldihydropteridine diphosphokinase [Deltaproteobacteria bacterium]
MELKAKVAIGLGSNLGDRKAVIRKAIQVLCDEFLENPLASSIYESEPWGKQDQPRFLNAVVIGQSEWKPPAIVNYLKNLERELGRTRFEKWGSREIDLDLLVYANVIFEGEGTLVPHPYLAERAFVLAPLSEVWGDWLHPIKRKTASELWAEFQANNPNPLISRSPLKT